MFNLIPVRNGPRFFIILGAPFVWMAFVISISALTTGDWQDFVLGFGGAVAILAITYFIGNWYGTRPLPIFVLVFFTMLMLAILIWSISSVFQNLSVLYFIDVAIPVGLIVIFALMLWEFAHMTSSQN